MVLEKRSYGVTQIVQGGAQRAAPLLVPAGMPRIASAVAAPAFHSMDATPGGVLDDLHLVCRRKFLQEFAIVGQLRKALRFDVVQRVRQGHFAVAVVMPIGFAVGGDVYKLGPVPRVGKTATD